MRRTRILAHEREGETPQTLFQIIGETRTVKRCPYASLEVVNNMALARVERILQTSGSAKKVFATSTKLCQGLGNGTSSGSRPASFWPVVISDCLKLRRHEL